MPPVDPPALTAAEATFEITLLARRFASAFAAFAHPGSDAPVGLVAALATASRVLGEHAQTLVALVPESVLLADARAAGAAVPIEGAAEPLGELAALGRALDALVRRARPVADGALLRLATHVGADLAALQRSITEALG